jgi:uncharacterized damage-inducible protein DinB
MHTRSCDPGTETARGSRFEGDTGTDCQRRILHGASDLLKQGIYLLESLTPDNYSRRLPVVFNGSIGGHYRHCLDHFSSLLKGADSELVDYDRRERDPRLETDPDYAAGFTRRLLGFVETLQPSSLATPVAVRCEVSYEHGNSPLTQSTLGRELAYAVAHGIHHFALISVMARLTGAALPAHFGVAPSTVAHDKQTASAA